MSERAAVRAVNIGTMLFEYQTKSSAYLLFILLLLLFSIICYIPSGRVCRRMGLWIIIIIFFFFQVRTQPLGIILYCYGVFTRARSMVIL